MFDLFGKSSRMAAICTNIVAHIDDGIVVVDHDSLILLFNGGAEKIFGYRAAEVLGQHLNTLIPERFHVQHEIHVEEFSTDPQVIRGMGERSRQLFGRRKNGEEFLVSITNIKVGAKDHPAYAAIVRDISENKKTEEELLRLASTDPLTGALNRREFTALAERDALRAQRYNRPLSILMFDLDHFKRLNDTYGHAAGDKALQRFTTICCNALRTVDIFGRWGGEEFVALLPETDSAGAANIAERLRKSVADNSFEFGGHKIGFTVSIGIAQYRSTETSVEGPLSRADQAVYDAKKAGRNRIAVHRA